MRGERQQAIDGVSLVIKRGERVALVGRNGSGKSSIISLIARFYQPQQGRVLVDGRLRVPLDAAFFSFLEQPGVPQLQVKLDCTTSPVALEIEQARYAPLGTTTQSQTGPAGFSTSNRSSCGAPLAASAGA